MCDTLVVLGSDKVDGEIIFANNSDRASHSLALSRHAGADAQGDLPIN